jgi:hypothetical protein
MEEKVYAYSDLNGNYLMERSLQKLMGIIPPPPKPRSSDVDWERLEKSVGLPYPKSFKEFISIYGGSVWFDNVSLFYRQAKSEEEIIEFPKLVAGKLEYLRDNMYDENYQQIELPLYPQKGGLFPFVIDYGGGLGCWKTDDKNPDKWPIAYWTTGPVVFLEKMTIAKMLDDFLAAKAHMFPIWGDVRKLDPLRIRLSQTEEPKKPDPEKKIAST